MWMPPFEPFVIAKMKNLPKFDERFVGYGYDKITFFMQLKAMDYQMVVHPSAFVVNRPHAKSNDSVQFRSNNKFTSCMKKLKKQFVNELAVKYSIDPKKYLT